MAPRVRDLLVSVCAGQRCAIRATRAAHAASVSARAGFLWDSDPMIFLDDSSGNWLTAPTRREMVDALLAHLPGEPEDWQLQMIAAACLGHREPLAVVVQET